MHLWLTSLSKKLSKPAAEKLVIAMNELVAKDEREYADSVLEVFFVSKIYKLLQDNPNYSDEELLEVYKKEKEQQ